MRKSVEVNTQSRVAALFNQGFHCHKNGHLTQAWQIYQQVLQLQPEHFDALYMSGLIASDNQKTELAIDLIGKAIKLNGNHVDALYNHAVELQKLNRMEEAVISFDKVIELNPYDYEAFFSRGNAFQELNFFDKALDNYIQTLKIKPDYAKAYYACGLSYQKLKRLNDALISYGRAIQIDSNYFNAYNNRGVVLHDLNRFVEALHDFDKAIALNPLDPEVWCNRGVTLQELNHVEESIASHDHAIELKPEYADAYFHRGFTFQKFKYFEEALTNYNRAIEINPNNAKFYSNRGIVFYELNKFDFALIDYDKSIALNFYFAEAYSNRGNTLKELMQFNEALANYDRAIEINPAYAEAYSNRGLLSESSLRYVDAIIDYDRAIAVQPNYPDAYFNKALCLLRVGDFSNGWNLYEWRWNIKEKNSNKFHTKIPNWDGQTYGKSIKILFWGEQGIGDEIFYFRILKNFTEINARITVAADIRLHALFKRSMPEAEFIDRRKIDVECNENSFDYQAPIGDIGLLCSVDPLIDFKLPKPFLHINKFRYNDIKNKNYIFKDKVVCGLSWKSANQKIGLSKSLNLIELAPLLLIENLEFVSLQYGSTKDEIEFVEKSIGKKIHTVDGLDLYNDIDGLVSLIDRCDFIVTTSNVTAHLTGSIGKKGIVLLPFSKGKIWYWHSGIGQSLWYPSLEMVSQINMNDWTDPIQKCKEWVLRQI
jgi:tetratricopeptide (TPR) repeat protein